MLAMLMTVTAIVTAMAASLEGGTARIGLGQHLAARLRIQTFNDVQQHALALRFDGGARLARPAQRLGGAFRIEGLGQNGGGRLAGAAPASRSKGRISPRPSIMRSRAAARPSSGNAS